MWVSLLLFSQALGSEEWIKKVQSIKFHDNNHHHVTEGNKASWHFLQAVAPKVQQILMSVIWKSKEMSRGKS